jgi:site-specific DNA-methyltransferase (adenine-specific)
VKGGKATFNSKYDKGIYEYPIYSGKDRFHPTQKSLLLFEKLMNKHSNEGDVVVDPYVGSGTTAVAAKNTNRIFICGEPSDEYFQEGYDRVYPAVDKPL